MTFAEIAASLPNGFHDAQLRRFEMDYVRRRLLFDLSIWIGSPGNEERREVYRPAHLTLENAAYLVIEPPQDTASSNEPGEIRIDAGPGQPAKSSARLPDAPPQASAAWMFLNELNTFLHFAAGHGSLVWTGPEEDRR